MRIRKMSFMMSLVTVLCLLESAHAAGTMKFCGSWKSMYTDSNMGEDWFTETAADGGPIEVDRTAEYTYAEVWRYAGGITWNLVWYGNLDSSGCTSTLTVYGYSTYIFRYFSKLQRGSGASARTIVVLGPNHSTWGDVPMYYDKVIVLAAVWQNMLPYIVQAAGPNDVSNIMPLMSRFLNSADTLAYPTGTTTWIATNPLINSGDCSHGGNFYKDYIAGVHRVCLTAVMNRKFVALHEMGHVVAMASDGPKPTTYDGDDGPYRDTDPDNRCNGVLVSGVTNCTTIAQCPVDAYKCVDGTCRWDGHVFNSREYIGAANGEAFGHFISAATLNNRNQSTNNGGFGEYREVPRSTLEGPGSNWPAPFRTNITHDEKWMETECQPGANAFRHLGTEWDWLSFYWNLWTITPNNLDIDEISVIWGYLSDNYNSACCNGPTCRFSSGGVTCVSPEQLVQTGKPWNLLQSSVNYQFNINPVGNNFALRGRNAGIDYF